MSRVHTYAPYEVNCIVVQPSTNLTWLVTGYDESNIVNLERNAETFTAVTSADNITTRIHNASTSGKATVSLQQTSNTNDIFDALYNNDQATRKGLFQFYIVDKSGRSSYFSEDCYLAVYPNAQFGKDMQTREWVVHMPYIKALTGGNAPLSAEAVAALAQLGVTVDPKWVE